MRREHVCNMSQSDTTFDSIGLSTDRSVFYFKQKARAMYMRRSCDVYQFRMNSGETIYACIHDNTVYVLGLYSEHWKHVKLRVSEEGLRYFNFKKQSFYFSV